MKQGDGYATSQLLSKTTAPHLQVKTEEIKPAAQACCQFKEFVGICVPFGGTYKGSGKKALASAGGPTTAPMQLM
jgi:hypothetical protein